jgi:hypothetical protein
VQEIGQMECRSKSEVHRDVPMYTKFKPWSEEETTNQQGPEKGRQPVKTSLN